MFTRLALLGHARAHVCHSDIHIVCTKRLARNVNIKLGPRSSPRYAVSTFNLSSNPLTHTQGYGINLEVSSAVN